MNRLIKEALDYVSSSFLIDVRFEKDISNDLPLQLIGHAHLSIVMIEERTFLVLSSDDLSFLAANNFLLVKRLGSKSFLPLIIVTTRVSNELKRVVKQLKSGLIVPGIYTILPSLLIHNEVNDIPDQINWVDTEKTFGIIPSYLVCYYLSGYFNEGFISSDVMKILGVSKMAVSRAVKEMVANKLIKENEYGRNIHYSFSDTRKSLWNHHRHRISKLSTGFVGVNEKYLSPVHLFKTGESALSKYTLISPPRTLNVGVCMSNNDRYMRPITPATIDGDYFFKIMNILPDNKYGEHNLGYDVMLQIFPYNPLIVDDVIGQIFLLFSRFNISDIRLKSSFLELETTVYNNFDNYKRI